MDRSTLVPARSAMIARTIRRILFAAALTCLSRADTACTQETPEPAAPPSLVDLPTPMESRPYRVRILLAADVAAWREPLQAALDRSVGRLWDADIGELTELSRADAAGLARWEQADAPQIFADEGVDFWFAVAIHDRGPERQISVRAWQPKYEWLSPVLSAVLFEPRETESRIVQLCWRLFRPEILIERVDQNDVRARIPAGDLQPADAAYRLFQPGDCLSPWLMYYNRQKVLQRRQELPWTYVRLDEINGPLVKGVVLSGLRTPLAGKTRGRIDKVAVASRPVFSETRLQIAVQNQPARLLAGYRLELRPKLPDPKPAEGEPKEADKLEPEDVATVLTDRLGEATLAAKPGQPLTWVFVYSGDLLLARVPFVAGSLAFQRLDVPDDSVRLQVEGQLQVLQSELINLVAERNTLIAAARSASKKNDWDRVTSLRRQLDQLPEKKKFHDRLAAIRVPALSAAKARRDRNAQVRVDRLCNDAAELIDRYLDPEKLKLIMDDLDELQKAAK